MDTALDVRGLTAEFRAGGRAFNAVRDVTFSLAKGEKLAVVGESGSGKSTLALAILGLLDPPRRIIGGEVFLNGRNLVGLGERQLKKIRGNDISLIFQDSMNALDPIKTVGAQLVDTLLRHQPLLSHRDARKRSVDLLREVEIPAADARHDDYPYQFSGGMLQRVMIAIAVANNPSVIIADEPTTALDVITQAQILSLLDSLVAERRISILLISHNLGVVADFCDTVQVMYAGRFVERARAKDLFARPRHPYTKALLASIPDPGEKLRRLPTIPGMPPAIGDMPPGCAFEPRCALGRGVELCRSKAPPIVPVDAGRADAFSACHFAVAAPPGGGG